MPRNFKDEEILLLSFLTSSFSALPRIFAAVILSLNLNWNFLATESNITCQLYGVRCLIPFHNSFLLNNLRDRQLETGRLKPCAYHRTQWKHHHQWKEQQKHLHFRPSIKHLLAKTANCEFVIWYWDPAKTSSTLKVLVMLKLGLKRAHATCGWIVLWVV